MKSYDSMGQHHHRPTIPSPEELQTLPRDGGEQWNRLVFEQSPYLLQHAGNPVDWYPWGHEAFEKATSEDKPVFLSIGYATCHWCHVMERESFEDSEVAEQINRHFVPIKVDREERPDIDQIYMSACQTMTGQGGWPLNCFLTPQATAFFAGTYYPKHGRHARVGMMELLPGIAQVWQKQRDKITKSAADLKRLLINMNVSKPSKGLAPGIDKKAFSIFQESFDQNHGGFGNAPKFPTPHQYLFLLRYWYRHGDKEALFMVEKSLKAMRLGGVFDHVGLGFHRYSTDKFWLLPHFEKMLYDQAMLIMVYSETYAATGDDFYRKTTEEIIEYALTKMQHPEGGFYSAEDADSDGVEGKFYVWTYEELTSVLNEDECAWFTSTFNIHSNGNFSEEATGEMTGANIPHLKEPLSQLEKRTNAPAEEWEAKWQLIRLKLCQYREKRVHPLKDDKVLTDWNGLMIAALARAALLLDNDDCRTQAQKAYRFVLENLTDEQGRLMKRFRNGFTGLHAHLNDYAFMIWAALELHQASLDSEFLKQAVAWQNKAIELFWDDQGGGFFFTRDDSDLVVRPKEIYDGAIPSGNSFMARNLVQLYNLTGQNRWQEYFDQLTLASADQVDRYPVGCTMLLIGHDLKQGPVQNVVFVGKSPSSAVLQPLKKKFLPRTVWLSVSEKNKSQINELAPFTEHHKYHEHLTLFFCQGFVCEQPVHGCESVRKRLNKLAVDEGQSGWPP